MEKQHFLALTQSEIKRWLSSNGEPSFRLKQMEEWVFQKKVLDFEGMRNLPAALKMKLQEEFFLAALEPVSSTVSKDGETIKYLWKLKDGKYVESVLILAPGRRTVCVSSQVGCPARCAFCASGKGGFFRNLTAGEIVEQILHIEKEEKVSHIVFMGMGEPLENEQEVIQAISMLHHKCGFSARRITVSTVGLPEKIELLAEAEVKVNLALSLHAPNQKLRQKIIPYARKYSLEELLEAVKRYSQTTKRDITFEYTLLADLNDQPEHAEELAELLKEWQCTVNLIPYNPVEGLRLQRPSTSAIRSFRSILDERGIINTCRYTKGDDIAAACGQLALKTNA